VVRLLHHSKTTYAPTDDVEFLKQPPPWRYEELAMLSTGKYADEPMRLIERFARELGANAIISQGTLETGMSVGGGYVGFSPDKIFFLAIRYLEDPAVWQARQRSAKVTSANSPPAPSTGCAACVAGCQEDRLACNGGALPGCYRLGACICRCKLGAGGCGEPMEELADCIARNTAKAAEGAAQTVAPLTDDAGRK